MGEGYTGEKWIGRDQQGLGLVPSKGDTGVHLRSRSVPPWNVDYPLGTRTLGPRETEENSGHPQSRSFQRRRQDWEILLAQGPAWIQLHHPHWGREYLTCLCLPGASKRSVALSHITHAGSHCSGLPRPLAFGYLFFLPQASWWEGDSSSAVQRL